MLIFYRLELSHVTTHNYQGNRNYTLFQEVEENVDFGEQLAIFGISTQNRTCSISSFNEYFSLLVLSLFGISIRLALL